MTPEELTCWTIRLALGGFVASIAARLLQRRGYRAGRVARWAWTVGCGLLWVHVGCAFQFYHHWSHNAAYMQTARETAETVGIDWGGGIFFNYLMMGLWATDVTWWWMREPSYLARSGWWDGLLHAYFAFMIVNATIVFEAGPLRWFALGATAALLLLWLTSPHHPRRGGDSHACALATRSSG